MLMKDSKRFSNKPQLVAHYERACGMVYGKSPYVAPKLFPLFSVFEDDLRDMHISPKDYAYVIAKLMENFVRTKGMSCLPVKLFLSDYCLNRYKKVQTTKTVEIKSDDKKIILLHDETTVARLYIERNYRSSNEYYRFCDIVKELEPILSAEWLQVYKNKGKRPELDALEQLCTEYHISKPVTDYFDIVSALR